MPAKYVLYVFNMYCARGGDRKICYYMNEAKVDQLI